MASFNTATIPTVAAQSHLIEYFYARNCDLCGEALAVLRGFQSAHREVYVLEHDVATYVGLARRYQLESTPATVVDGRSLIYGIPTLETLTAVSGATTRSASAAPIGGWRQAWARLLAWVRTRAATRP